MTPEQENFDELRRLLKLKRCEQPPPGYFNDFSRQVIAKIRASVHEDREQLLDRLSWEVPWLQRLVAAFQAKPALAVGFGMVVCALLVGGVIYSESVEYKPMPLMPTVESLAKVSPAPTVVPAFGLAEAGVGTPVAGGTNNSMNPIIQPSGSLFDVRINPQPVSFQFGGNGK
ncbi:MAG: hypothetical protein MUF81_05525 [Verrucomicrobia bacterium]|jgi:hypothetical protein|nr:hypothetical protein [Verrucomicrobiota bacterium]